VTDALRTPARRIGFAVALSILVHVILLWLPKVPLPRDEARLPPLMAKLEPLPNLAAKPKPPAKPRTPAKESRASPPVPLTASTIPVTEPEVAAEAIPEPPSPPLIEAVSAVQATTTLAAAEQPAAHPLPKHAQLTFAVYKGLDNFRIGEVHHQLEINGENYTLIATTQTVGLASLFKSYQLIQTSRGKVVKQGLQPWSFEEEKITADGNQKLHATLDWTSQKLRFSHGGETELPADTQDILSIFYQLSQFFVSSEIIPLAVSNGKKLEKYSLEVGAVEEINTPLGKLRALHLRKLHIPGEAGFEIWLGLEYRLLPVKLIQTEPSGEVIGEIAITDIRVADE
jgi:hypothetical protein